MATSLDKAVSQDVESESDSDDEPPQIPLLVRVGVKVNERINKRGVLFPKQVEALNKICEWFESPETTDKTAVVAMPTGSGKTGVICCLPYKFGEAVAKERLTLEDVDLHKPMLVIAPSLEIRKQLKENLELHENNTFIVKRKIIKMNQVSDQHYRVKTIERADNIARQGLSLYHVCLVNAQKGHKKPKPGYRPSIIYTWDDLPPNLFSVVVVDEAHHLPSKQWSKIIERFQGHAKVVFFTATPYRADKKIVTADIAVAGLAYHLTRAKAIQDRIIRNTNPIDLEPHSFYESSKSIQVTFDMLPKIHRRLVEKNKKQPLPGNVKHMAILIAPYIDDLPKIADEWNKTFTPIAVCIHSDLPERQREQALQKVKDGKVALLVIVQMLLEGFDHPPISIAAIATRIVSPVKFAQFIGRAQRVVRLPDNGEIEQEGIMADIISDGFFQQGNNYKQFEDEALIPIDNDAEVKMQ